MNVDQRLSQFVEVDVAGLHHLGGIRFVDQGQQEVLQRRKLMPPRVGQRERGVDGLLERVRE